MRCVCSLVQDREDTSSLTYLQIVQYHCDTDRVQAAVSVHGCFYKEASGLINQHSNGIEKCRALKCSPLILKLQVTFTKQFSFKTTFKGHSIIMYLHHASTKDVINTLNQCQIWIYLKTVLCTAEFCSLRSCKPKLYGDIKSRYPKIIAATEKLLYYCIFE